MVEEAIRYETESVRVVRGTEARTISKRQEDGWELVSQETGKLRSELRFRRPAPKSKQKLMLMIGGAVAAVLLAIIVIGVMTESKDPAAPEASNQPEQPEAAAKNEEESVPEATPESEPAVLTVQSSEEFAALLELGDHCSPVIADFAEAHRGETVEFDGNIGAMNGHGDYKTRFDILIGAKDFDENSQPGPYFQFRDVNLTYDLKLVGENPGSIGIGDNVRVKATIDKYEEQTCLFLIDPVETELR